MNKNEWMTHMLLLLYLFGLADMNYILLACTVVCVGSTCMLHERLVRLLHWLYVLYLFMWSCCDDHRMVQNLRFFTFPGMQRISIVM